jgi:hypothetical protein
MNKFLLFFFLLPLSIFSQTKMTLSGYVTDQKSGERLPFVSVYDTISKKGIFTNNFGFFSLTLPARKAVLKVSCIGYQSQIKLFSSGKSEVWNLELSMGESLSGVDITADAAIEQRTQMSTLDIPVAQIKKIPAFMGEVDVIKVLQLTPGVHSGGEGSTGMYVRGGGPDQNLILLDGVPLYNVSHLFGFFSVFNADALKSVQLTKGGYPARYGGRLSSVLDIQMKEGNNKEFHGEGSLGLVSSKLTLEGPILKNKASYLISTRRTYIDVLAAPIIAIATQGQGTGGYYFYDLNAKVNWEISPKDRIYLSTYNGDDKFYASSKTQELNYEERFKFGLAWGNSMSALRWNHQYSPRLFSNFTTTYSRYRYEVSANSYSRSFNGQQVTTEEFDLRYFSGIRDFAAKLDFDYAPHPDHSVKFGLNSIQHRFTPDAITQKYSNGINQFDTTLSPSKPINGVESFVYAEDEWKVNSKLNVAYGLHFSTFLVNSKWYHSLQPRVSMRYLLPGNIAWKASYAKMQQYIHLLSNSGISLPTDLWLPATDKVAPMTSNQWATGFAKGLKNNEYELSLEGYYKTMQNLIEYKEGESFLGSTDWQNKVETGGRGWSYGSELFLQKKTGKLSGWVGYTLSWTWRQFENLNDGLKYPYRYDRRHDVSVVASYDLRKNLTVSFTWVYGTGNAMTFPKNTFNLPGQWGGVVNYYDYGQRNSYRMPPYHRMDLGMNKTKKRKWGEETINISVYNAYSRLNPYFIYISNRDRWGNPTRTVNQVSLFPIIPSISYGFKF